MPLKNLSGVSRLALLLASLAVVVLAGCASPKNKAPVEDRSAARAPASAQAPAGSASDAAGKLLPGAENAGKPG